VVVDDRGWLYLHGRERDEINKGGMKVYPGDIDSVAERFEETVDVCTFGYEEPLHGENIGIAVVLKSRSDESVVTLYNWLKRPLASHQMPQRWYLINEIPRTSRGKINRAEVAQKCGALKPPDLCGIFL
jgi:acyl-coenzyme A synthetase/AMP-(fatty) acid ligase